MSGKSRKRQSSAQKRNGTPLFLAETDLGRTEEEKSSDSAGESQERNAEGRGRKGHRFFDLERQEWGTCG